MWADSFISFIEIYPVYKDRTMGNVQKIILMFMREEALMSQPYALQNA
jgi:hypothetical protein